MDLIGGLLVADSLRYRGKSSGKWNNNRRSLRQALFFWLFFPVDNQSKATECQLEAVVNLIGY